MKLKLKSARQQIKENEAARDAQFLQEVYTSFHHPGEVFVYSRGFAGPGSGGTFFDSLDACLAAARKRKFPEPLIQAFIEELNRKTPPAPLETKQPVQQGEKVTK